METQICVVLTDPPPLSINEMYSSGPHGQRFLTAAGKHFKARLAEEVSKVCMSQAWGTVYDAVYKTGGHWVDIDITVYFPNLYNKSWKKGGSLTAKGEPRSPYQKKDGSNYIKLIEDAVTTGTGIDDSANIDTHVRKREDAANPRVEVTYTITDRPFE